MWIGHRPISRSPTARRPTITGAATPAPRRPAASSPSTRSASSDGPTPPPRPAGSADLERLDDLAGWHRTTAGGPAREAIARYRAIEAQIPEPTLAPGDRRRHGRWTSRSTSGATTRTSASVVPRRFLEVLGGLDQPAPAAGSGRLELARRMVDPANPLTPARDGQPALEAPLRRGDRQVARRLRRDGPRADASRAARLAGRPSSSRGGWSIKAMHRLIVLRAPTGCRAGPTREAERLDPDNELCTG